MSLAEKLTSIKTKLTSVLSDINAALVAKGATEVTSLADVPTAIESVQSGGGEIGKPYMDTSKITEWQNFFSWSWRNDLYPMADFSNAKNLSDCFKNTYLKEVDISAATKVTTFGAAFMSALGLHTIILPPTKTSLFSQSTVFGNCGQLKNLSIAGTLTVNSNGFYVSHCPLTVDSLVNILNACSDNTGGKTYTLYIGSNNIAKLTAEQLDIAYQKNINLE